MKQLLTRLAMLIVVVCWAQDATHADASSNVVSSGNRADVSPVFANRLDCQAVIWGQPARCATDECAAALSRQARDCETGDCEAFVYGSQAYCDTTDCQAVLRRSLGLCRSQNCRAIVRRTVGLCKDL